MRIQVKEYIEFIKAFTERTNIMTKTFYIVVPYTPPVLNLGAGKGTGLFNKKNSKPQPGAKEDFEEYATQIEQRVAVVQQGITRAGVRAVQLGTEEAIEVFYRLFNPGDVEKPITVN